MPLFLFLLVSMNVATDPGCIQGKVLDPAGEPVPFAYVTASNLDNTKSIQVETDEDGAFEIDELHAGERYAVLASDKQFPGYVSPSSMREGGAAPATVVAEGECPSLTLHLPARARLLVEATNLLTGEPIRSVHAQFRFDTEWSWKSDVNERGELVAPPDSAFEVRIGAAGYATSAALKITTSKPGEEHEIAIALRPVQMGCISGTVIDEQGSGVPQARIQAISANERFLPSASTSTDAAGQFRIDGVQPGPHTILVDAAGYPFTAPYRVMTGITVTSGAPCADAIMALGPKAAKLRVRVVDSVTQEPVKDASVWLIGEYTNGGWSMRVIADPTPVPALSLITVHAAAEGYIESQPVTVSPMEPEQTQEITIALQPKQVL